jgi:dTDP-4-dehydrorhamnose reductase
MAARDRHDTWVTVRNPVAGKPYGELFDASRVIAGVDADDPASIDRALEISNPDVVVNTIGLVKQRPDGADPGPAFTANCFIPHFLRLRCTARGARLIQISTDCVFTGARGRYTESDDTDAVDVYGLTKRLGEVGEPHLTIRTSLIGRDLAGATGLLEWFVAQRGKQVNGFSNAIFSGLTTPYLADTILTIATDHPDIAGLRHVAAEPIDKHTLLTQLRDALELDIEVVPVAEPRIDRSLDDSFFRRETGSARPTWDAMIEGLRQDPTPYDILRGR